MLTVVKCTRLSLPSADGQVYVTVALGEFNFEEVKCCVHIMKRQLLTFILLRKFI